MFTLEIAQAMALAGEYENSGWPNVQLCRTPIQCSKKFPSPRNLNLSARQNKPIKFMTNDYPFFGKAWSWKDDSDPICSCAVFHKYMKRGAQGCVQCVLAKA